LIYDNSGSRIRTFPLNDELLSDSGVVCINWYPVGNHTYVTSTNSNNETALGFCLCFDNGMMLLCHDEKDINPVLVKTHLKISHCSWDSKGELIAISGTVDPFQRTAPNDKDAKTINVVQFYDNVGTYLRCLRIPGEHIAAISWERSSLRMALAVDSYIFFANIRLQYKWTYFSNTLVYTHT
jgi:WD repeat-containing protein 35